MPRTLSLSPDPSVWHLVVERDPELVFKRHPVYSLSDPNLWASAFLSVN